MVELTKFLTTKPHIRQSLPILFILGVCWLLVSCKGNDTLDIARSLLGYTPPPEKTTVLEELQLEYERCMKIGIEEDCAQAAYDVVRKVKGLDPKVVPKGIVTILQEHWEEIEEEKEQRSDGNQEKTEVKAKSELQEEVESQEKTKPEFK